MKSLLSRQLVKLVPIAAALSMVGVLNASQAQEMQEVTVLFGAPVPNVTQSVLISVPQEMGYFEQEGLRVKEINAGLGEPLQAVATGLADFQNPEANKLVTAVGSGLPLKAFARVATTWAWSVAVRPDSPITSVADLRGKKVGVISLVSGSAGFARTALEASGVDLTEVELLPVGVGVSAAQALENGTVDALTSWIADYRHMETAGFALRYLPNPPKFDGLMGMVWVASNKLLQEQPELAEKFARAAFKGVIFSAVNPEAAIRMGWKRHPDMQPAAGDEQDALQKDLKIIEAQLSTFLPKEGDLVEHKWGAASEADWEDIIAYEVNIGTVKTTPSPSDLWYSGIMGGINDFDKNAVIDQARNYHVAE